jgi:hypothetical protein
MILKDAIHSARQARIDRPVKSEEHRTRSRFRAFTVQAL